MVRRSLKVAAGLALALLLAGANTASAAVLTMSGEYFMNRGPLVDIPANGGPVFCFGGSPATGCVSFLKPLNGGIPAAPQQISVMGSGFTLPLKAFAAAGGPANRKTVAVQGLPTVIQLASQFSLLAPAGTGVNGDGVVPGGPASFQANAWSQDPGQAARLGANFTWCPPDGNCATTTLSQTYGAFRARIKYTAGAKAFGGTMSMMLKDTGVVSVNIGGTPPQVLHQLVGGTANTDFDPQMAGGGYANARVLPLFPGPIHSSYMVGTPCTGAFGAPPSPPGCGIITAQGAFLFNNPASTNFDWGMPWTTGTVFVKNLPGPIPTNDPATTLSAMGTDSRNDQGIGRITMVAGATTERAPSGNHFAVIEIISLEFAGNQTPTLSAPAIVAMVALMLLAGGYMARGTFASGKSQA